MEGNYPVYFGGRAVGKVQVLRQGLYYRFLCRCRLSGDVVCRVCVRCDGSRESLGILTPEEDGFGLSTRLPVKHFSEGTPEFYIMPNRPEEGRFVPIYPEEPFTYIERLKQAYLAERGGRIGVILPEKV